MVHEDRPAVSVASRHPSPERGRPRVSHAGAGETRPATLSHSLALLLFFVLTSLFLSQFRLPFTPIMASNDQWDFINHSARLWGGEIIYRDFYERTTPGTAVVDLVSFRLFGLKNWIPNFHLILLGVGLTWLTVSISRRILCEPAYFDLLPGLLFLAFAFLPHMEDTHRWYSCVASLAALAVVMERRTLWRLSAAGVFSGLASFFTQTQGVLLLLGLGTFLLWEGRQRRHKGKDRRQQWGCLLGAWGATVLGVHAYFIAQAGLGRFIDCVIRIPFLYLSADTSYTWHAYLSQMPRLPHWYSLPTLAQFLFIYPLLPFVYIVALLDRSRQANGYQEKTARLILLNITGLWMFAGVAAGPTHFRLCSVSAPAFIVLVCWMREHLRRGQMLAGALVIAALYFAVIQPLRMQTMPIRYLDLPRGRMAFSTWLLTEYELMRWLSSRTEAGELFMVTGDGYFLFPLALQQVGEVSGYNNTRATRPEGVQSAVAALSKYRVRFVEWPPGQSDPKFYVPEEDSLGPLREYVMKNYHLVKRFESEDANAPEEIWERNP